MESGSRKRVWGQTLESVLSSQSFFPSLLHQYLTWRSQDVENCAVRGKLRVRDVIRDWGGGACVSPSPMTSSPKTPFPSSPRTQGKQPKGNNAWHVQSPTLLLPLGIPECPVPLLPSVTFDLWSHLLGPLGRMLQLHPCPCSPGLPDPPCLRDKFIQPHVPKLWGTGVGGMGLQAWGAWCGGNKLMNNKHGGTSFRIGLDLGVLDGT